MNEPPPDAWAAAYVARLPAEYRPHPADPRIIAAVQTAQANGWTAVALAAAVTDSTGRASPRHPVGFARTKLEQLAARPAGQTPAPAAVSGGFPRPRKPMPADAWRAYLPQRCTHSEGEERELTPNQCWSCRLAAGDPRAAEHLEQLAARAALLAATRQTPQGGEH